MAKLTDPNNSTDVREKVKAEEINQVDEVKGYDLS